MIHTERGGAVFARSVQALDAAPAATGYRDLLRVALDETRRRADEAAVYLPLDLPLVVGRAAGVPPAVSEAVAAACVFVATGIELFDSLLDGELDGPLAQHVGERVALSAVSLLAILPQRVAMAVRDQGAPPELCSALSIAITESLWRVTDGQFVDRDPATGRSVEAYLQVVGARGGEECALYAGACSLMAGDAPGRVQVWSDLGMSLGMYHRLLRDLALLGTARGDNELRRGRWTLPVLYALSEAEDEARTALLNRLVAVREGDEDALAALNAELPASPAVAAATEYAESFRLRAVGQLEAIAPPPETLDTFNRIVASRLPAPPAPAEQAQAAQNTPEPEPEGAP